MTRCEYSHFASFYAQLRRNTVTYMPELPAPEALPRGGVVGTIITAGWVTESESPWFVGPFGLQIANRTITEFVPFKGRLGPFQIPDDLIKPIF
jgi:hypothetical protein